MTEPDRTWRGLADRQVLAVDLGPQAAIEPFLDLQPAAADNWGAGAIDPAHRCTVAPDYDSECTANNTNHWVWFEETIPTDLKNAFVGSLANDYDALIPTFDYLVRTSQSDVDLKILYRDYPSSCGEDGWCGTVCVATYGGGVYGAEGYNMWCRPQHLSVNSDKYPSCFAVAECRKWYACHELGHSIGLAHAFGYLNNHPNPSQTCMSYADKPRPTDLKQHDRDHIANCYPHPSNTPARPPACVGDD